MLKATLGEGDPPRVFSDGQALLRESALTLVADGDQPLLPATMRVNGFELPLWPEGQTASTVAGSLMAITRLGDHEIYHAALIDAVLAAEKDPCFCSPADLVVRGGCGVKVRNLPEWGVPAITLVHARATLLAHYLLERVPVFVDDTWASVSRNGDYCVPHSHLRSDVGVIYMLDPGDGDPADRLAGQLCFADPRISWCCPQQPGCVSRQLMPVMAPGSMLAFAGEYDHSVNPYHGRRPRITLSWNITRERLPGKPRETPG